MATNRSQSPKGRVDTRASVLCPHCNCILSVGCDMWGLYWFCEGCGFSTEDDGAARKPPLARAGEPPARNR
jgi:hypothetical protein